jgi:hypothetical protein
MSEQKNLSELPEARDRTQYVQLYRSAMRALRQLAIEAPMAHAVLYVLMERMDQRNALICSLDTMVKLTGKSRSTIARALAELRKRNYIETVKVGNINAIIINKRVAWTDDVKLRQKVAVFDAAIVATSDEQDSTYGELTAPLLKLPPVLVPPELASIVDDREVQSGETSDLPGVE